MVTDPAWGWTDTCGVDLEEEKGAASAVTHVVRRRQPQEDPRERCAQAEGTACAKVLRHSCHVFTESPD